MAAVNVIRSGVGLGFVILVPFSVVVSVPAENPDVAPMSDDELVVNLHRKDARDEFDRRLHEYGDADRQKLLELFENRKIAKKYPRDFSEQELVERLRVIEDWQAYSKAQEKLSSRYESASAGEQQSLRRLLGDALGAMESKDTRNSESIVARKETVDARIGLVLAAGKILSEAEAIALFDEVYLKSGVDGGCTRFVRALDVAKLAGPNTVKALEKVYAHIGQLDLIARQEQCEDPELELEILGILGRCGNDGFEALKKVNWSTSERGIRSMGAIGTFEARDQLLAIYEECLDELSDRRLTILSALTLLLYKTDDELTRDILRKELSEFIIFPMTHIELTLCERATELAANTRDTYFLLDLKGLQQYLDTHRIAIDPVQTEVNLNAAIQQFRTKLSNSIEKLEGGSVIERSDDED